MSANALRGFIDEVAGDSRLRVEEDLGGGFVRLRTSEAERRQAKQDIRCVEDVVLELLRNARDAGASFVWLATSREGDVRTITCIDDGMGIPEGMWERIFEPRVTTKLDSFREDQWGVHGRGMALYSIACNTVQHAVVASAPAKGCAIQVKADVTALPERADQSSQPKLIIDDAGRHVLRGPRNINRIVAEFSLSPDAACLVFTGTPNEILATLVETGRRALPLLERTLADVGEDVPVYLRPALAATPEELASIAAAMGLETSERSARRILDGQIAPLSSPANGAWEDARHEPAKDGASRTHLNPSGRMVRLSDEDRAELARRVGEAFAETARSYYLDPDVEPDIRVSREGVRIFIPFADVEEGRPLQ